MPTTFPTIASGWRAAVNWKPETIYGVAPTGVPYNWVGDVQEFHGVIDKNPILVYRMDGSTDFPAYILKGQRNVDFTVTYFPQDINLLTDVINNIGTASAVSHSFIIKDYDTGALWTVTGAMPNTVTISGKTGQAMSVEVAYWCQNILLGNPAGVSYASDPGNVPFFFSQESVQIPSGVPQPQTLTFTGSITNNLQRVPQFGTDVIRSIPTLLRKAEGSLTATFAQLSDYPNESNIPYTTAYTDTETDPSGLTGQIIRLLLGTNASGPTSFYLDYTSAKLPKIDLDTRITDLVALELPWTAQGASVHT